MKTFYILTKSEIKNFEKDIICICDDFYASATFFNFLWALNRSMWSVALLWLSIVVLMISCNVSGIFPPNIMLFGYAFFTVYCGYIAPQHLINHYLSKGFVKMDIVVANNEDEALLTTIYSLQPIS